MNKPTQKAPVSRALIISIVAVVLILTYLIAIYFHTPKPVTATTNPINLPQYTTAKIAWPAYGQAAVGGVGYGVIATNGEQVAHPIASIAKVILAMAVLDKYPLNAGETGPTITISQADVDFYHANLAQGGSLVPVNLGEQLSEYQALQGLLIASGDNLADTLAIWAYGSIDNYMVYANQMVASLGMTKTHIADPSGLSAETASSASDLVILGEKSLKYPAIADIVSQPKVTLPVAGLLYNYNSIIGKDGIVGIKTGNTNEAGGCFLFAAKNATNPTQPTMITAILGAKNLSAVLADSRTFIQANMNNLKVVPVLTSGQVVGTYSTPWGQKLEAVVKKDLSVMTVSGDKIATNINLNSLKKSAEKDSEIGTVTITAGPNTQVVPVYLSDTLSNPKYSWKLIHPLK